MTFEECIDLAVEGGALKKKKGDEAKAAYHEMLKEAQDQGLTGGAMHDYAMRKAVDRISSGTEARNWQRLKDIRIAAEVTSEFTTSSLPNHGLWQWGNRIEINAISLARQALSYASDGIAALRPRAAGMIHPTRTAKNIIRAMKGETVPDDASAADLAKGFTMARQYLVRRANMEGASIQLKDGPPPLRMDRHKLIRNARRQGYDTTRDEFVNDAIKRIDWEAVREADGSEVSISRRYAKLHTRYKAMYTHGNSLIRPELKGESSLAQRLSSQDIFYFKTADDYFYMLNKYGDGDAWTQIIGDIATLARDVALLKNLGPYPEKTLKFGIEQAQKRASELDTAKGSKPGRGRSMSDRTNTEASTLQDRYRIQADLVNNGAESAPAQFLASTRTFVLSSILSGAFLSNIGDVGFAYNTAFLNKLPVMGHLTGVVREFAKMSSGRRAAEAAAMGFGAESTLNSALSLHRYLGPLDGFNFVRRLSDSMFRATWMTPWTEASKTEWQSFMTLALGQYSKTEFSKVPFVDSMRRYEITEADWDMLRSTPLKKSGRGEHLLPVDLLNRQDLDEMTRSNTADKFFDYIINLEREASPTSGTAEHAALGGAIDRPRLAGQVMQTFSAVKTFPVVVATRHWHNMMLQPTLGGKLGYIARFVTILTVAGAFITQFKEMAIRGRDPLNMNPVENPYFWVRATLNGGSLGFLGDAIFNNVNQYRGGGLGDVFAGPILDFATDARDLAVGNLIEVIQGKETKLWRESVEFGERYAPIPWQTKLLVQRAIITDLLLLSDPLAYRRLKAREKKRLTERGQATWWGVTEPFPSRPPDLSAMFRGSKKR